MGLKSVASNQLLSAIGASYTGNLMPKLYEAQSLLLPHTSAGLALVKAGIRNSRWLLLGDSHTYGCWSTVGDTGDLKAGCYPQHLTDILNSNGINAHCNSFYGYGGNGIENNYSYDARVTNVLNSSWSPYSGSDSFGGILMQCNNTTNALNFTPKVNTDTFYFTGITTSGVQNFNCSINSGSATTLTLGTGTAGLASVTVTATLGANTGKVQLASAGLSFLCGIEAWDSSKKWVSVMNAGWPGMQTPSLANRTAGWEAASQLGYFAPDLIVIMTGTNDWNAGTSVSSCYTAYQQLITLGQAAGADVVLMSPAPTQNATTPLTTQVNYVNAMRAAAQAANIPFIDHWSNFVSYEYSNPLGLYNQLYHPSSAGYAKYARSMFNLLGNV